MRLSSSAGVPEVLALGAVEVEVYPYRAGLGLEAARTLNKRLGGTCLPVVATAARLGRTTAVISAVGDDPFGRFVRRSLRELAVDDGPVVTTYGQLTPVSFCEPPPDCEHPQLGAGQEAAARLPLSPHDIDLRAVQSAQLLWLSADGFHAPETRQAHLVVLEARARKAFTVLDLDARPVPARHGSSGIGLVRDALGSVTVAVGGRQAWHDVVRETCPDRAADALLKAGVDLAIVKQGLSVLAKSRSGERVEVSPVGRHLGTADEQDSFDGVLAHGLLEKWSLETIVRRANAAEASSYRATTRESRADQPAGDLPASLIPFVKDLRKEAS